MTFLEYKKTSTRISPPPSTSTPNLLRQQIPKPNQSYLSKIFTLNAQTKMAQKLLPSSSPSPFTSPAPPCSVVAVQGKNSDPYLRRHRSPCPATPRLPTAVLCRCHPLPLLCFAVVVLRRMPLRAQLPSSTLKMAMGCRMLNHFNFYSKIEG